MSDYEVTLVNDNSTYAAYPVIAVGTTMADRSMLQCKLAQTDHDRPKAPRLGYVHLTMAYIAGKSSTCVLRVLQRVGCPFPPAKEP